MDQHRGRPRMPRFVFGLVVIFLLIAPPVFPHASAAEQVMALTFDDLPCNAGDLQRYQEVTTMILGTLEVYDIPVTGFVNEKKLHLGEDSSEVEQRTDLLRQWVLQGHDIGNHTYSHVNPDEVTLEEYFEDVIRGEEVTRGLLAEAGKELVWFRHPFLRFGPTEEYRRSVLEFLEQRGYRIAPITLDNSEWLYDAAYRVAIDRGDAELQHRIGGAYLEHMSATLDHFEALTEESFGRTIPHVLLLHANSLNAVYLDDLLELLIERGYSFASLAQVLEDPIYERPLGGHEAGLSWIHRWRLSEGKEIRWGPDAHEWIRELYDGNY